MQNEVILARFKELGKKPSGKRELVSLSDVDNAFANSLMRAFDGLVFTTASRENRAMAEFLKRQVKDQVSVGYYNDVSACLAAQRASGAGQHHTPHEHPVNRLALPLLNIGRDLSYSFYTGAQMRDVQDAGELLDDNDALIALVSELPVQLNYKIWAVAADRETATLMSSVIGSWLRQWQTGGQTAFEAWSTLGGKTVVVEAHLDDPKTIAWMDVSTVPEIDRVYALELDLSVNVGLLVAHFVDTFEIRTELSVGVQSGS